MDEMRHLRIVAAERAPRATKYCVLRTARMSFLLREMPLHCRPRERLAEFGASALSDTDLLAVILGSGVKGSDVLKVSSEVLKAVDVNWPLIDHKLFMGIHGLGTVKAKLLVASLEFARRRISPSGTRISKAADVVPLLGHFSDRKQEHLISISLNGAHEVIATRVVTVGLVNSAQVHPREVFCDPITDRACAVIVAHNHPSGNTRPSEQDVATTRVLKDAGHLLGIRLLDHIIFSRQGFYSFADEGRL